MTKISCINDLQCSLYRDFLMDPFDLLSEYTKDELINFYDENFDIEFKQGFRRKDFIQEIERFYNRFCQNKNEGDDTQIEIEIPSNEEVRKVYTEEEAIKFVEENFLSVTDYYYDYENEFDYSYTSLYHLKHVEKTDKQEKYIDEPIFVGTEIVVSKSMIRVIDKEEYDNTSYLSTFFERDNDENWILNDNVEIISEDFFYSLKERCDEYIESINEMIEMTED